DREQLGARLGDARDAARRRVRESARPDHPGIRRRLRRRGGRRYSLLGLQRRGFVDRRRDHSGHRGALVRGAPRPNAEAGLVAERIALRVAEGGQRVDRFLAAHSQLSRSAISRLAKDGRVLVDGAAVEPAYKVRVGQELVVEVPDAEPALSLAAENIPIDVLYEDEDVIVVNKPAGLVVHPAYGHATGTLVNAVVGRIAAWASGAERRALLHVRPVTGRTHQIRARLAYARLPIVGDPVYGKRGDHSGLERQFLHAWRLSVRLPRGGERTFTAPLAPELAAYLRGLGTPVASTPLLEELG